MILISILWINVSSYKYIHRIHMSLYIQRHVYTVLYVFVKSQRHVYTCLCDLQYNYNYIVCLCKDIQYTVYCRSLWRPTIHLYEDARYCKDLQCKVKFVKTYNVKSQRHVYTCLCDFTKTYNTVCPHTNIIVIILYVFVKTYNIRCIVCLCKVHRDMYIRCIYL